MEESIKNFPKQFRWQPEIINKRPKTKYKNFIVCGMGGSALAGDLLRITNDNELRIRVWRDYNLPQADKDTLIIASSYSGNTEETIDAFKTALSKKLPTVAITTGGKLLTLAKKYKIPYIQIPNTGIQPRVANGYMIKALAAVTGLKQTSRELFKLSTLLDARSAEAKGESLARSLRGKIPIIYSSNRIFPVSYNWKIKFNETAKIPAFCNAFPEMNHNEMTGFDDLFPNPLPLRRGGGKGVRFSFIFLEDLSDNPRIKKRMKITKKLLEDRSFSIFHISLPISNNIFHKIFQNLLIADWTAYYLAKYYGHDPDKVPMVEEFKKLIK